MLMLILYLYTYIFRLICLGDFYGYLFISDPMVYIYYWRMYYILFLFYDIRYVNYATSFSYLIHVNFIVGFFVTYGLILFISLHGFNVFAMQRADPIQQFHKDFIDKFTEHVKQSQATEEHGNDRINDDNENHVNEAHSLIKYYIQRTTFIILFTAPAILEEELGKDNNDDKNSMFLRVLQKVMIENLSQSQNNENETQHDDVPTENNDQDDNEQID